MLLLHQTPIHNYGVSATLTFAHNIEKKHERKTKCREEKAPTNKNFLHTMLSYYFYFLWVRGTPYSIAVIALKIHYVYKMAIQNNRKTCS